jgi:two-component system response regulator NreC
MKKLRILLADDHIVMRTGLRALLERQPNLEVVGESENGREAVELVASLRPDVVVMDVGMPVLNGIEATKTIVSKHPTTAVVILSMHADESYVMRALKAGARGYLLKDSAAIDLISETHRSHIREKLNLHNPAELILYAVRKGIIS